MYNSNSMCTWYVMHFLNERLWSEILNINNTEDSEIFIFFSNRKLQNEQIFQAYTWYFLADKALN